METQKITKKLNIALVSHDRRKAEIIEWVNHNIEFLSRQNIICTGTTGKLVQDAFLAKHYNTVVTCCNSGPLGGDAEIAAMVVRGEINLCVFLIDDLNPQPHEADINMLLRQCRVHNIPVCCNRYTADLVLTSTLWDDTSYVPTKPKYVEYERN